MTKNEYQTDIHELIQKRPPPTTKSGRQRIKLAFDKCTLLSSQRSDAPTLRLHSHHRGATSLSSCPSHPGHSAGASSRIPSVPQAGDPECGSCCDGGGSLLEGSQTLRPSLYPLGRTTRRLRGSRAAVQSAPHPGRVASPAPRRRSSARQMERVPPQLIEQTEAGLDSGGDGGI